MGDTAPPVSGGFFGVGARSLSTVQGVAVPFAEPPRPTDYFKRVHLHRNVTGIFTNAALYTAAPTHSTDVNTAPGTNLQYEIYTIQIHTSHNQLNGSGVSIKGFNGNATYRTVWERLMAAGGYNFTFPMESPLMIGESLIVVISTAALATVWVEMFGAIRAVT